MGSRLRSVSITTVACLCLVALLAAGCGSPVESDAPTAADQAKSAQEASASSSAFAAGPDTAGDIKVVWKSASGTARQDPIGLLSGTPLVLDGTHLRAKATVPFKPNSPNAQSADGKYVYTLDLTATANGMTYKRTMTIDWTMTIVWSAANRNEFHAVYKADVSAYYNSVAKILRDGSAKGTATTTDTGITTGSSSTPHTSTAPFEWTCESQ
ncbi:MAG TPA: hypothetical protein VIK85_04200 [Coriobacteriia bacterium]